MLSKLPSAKIKSSIKGRFEETSLPKIHAMTWLNYRLFLRKLAKGAAEQAKADKSAVIRRKHVKDAAKRVLESCKG